MVSKLFYLLMDWETFDSLPALEQVRGVIEVLQASTIALETSIMELLAKIVSNVNLKDVNYCCKRLILDIWLGPGSASVD